MAATNAVVLRRKKACAYYKANREHRKALARKYYRSNKSARLKSAAAYRSRTVKKRREYMRKYYQRHKHTKFAAYKAKARGYPAPTRPRPAKCEAGCGRPALCQDHDHATGQFRGWLCNQCNLGLGTIGDTLADVRRLGEYLRRSK